MAQERPLSPEKQLLRLIEEQKTTSAGAGAQVLHHWGLSFFSLGAWLGRISFFRDRLKRSFAERRFQHFDLKVINGILCFFIAVSVFYFLFNLTTSIINFKKIPNLKLQVQKGSETAEELGGDIFFSKGVSSYLEKIRSRDIFKMGAAKTGAGTVNLFKTPSSKVADATQDLKLVGISWSNDPIAMIEDSKALRTFFVTRGQMIGEVRVQAIFKDKVVLSYGGEEIELR